MQVVQLNKLREERSERTNDFIDFILDMSGSKGLEVGKGFKEVVQKGDANSLHELFVNKGYNIPFEECYKIIQNKEYLKDYKNNIIRLSY